MDQELSNLAARISASQSLGYLGLRFLIAGLVGELLLIVFPLKRPVLNRILGVLFVAFVIAGCLLEYGSETRVSALVSQEEAQAGVKIASANKRANEAAAQAAHLGVSVDTLHNFVAGKQREIDKQFGQFRAFATGERKRAEAAIADLNADRAEIDKARSEAAASVADAKKLVADAKASILEQRVAIANMRGQLSDLSSRAIVTEAAIAPRTIDQKNADRLRSVLRDFKGQKYVGMLPSASRDERPLWASMDKILQDAGWKRDETDFPFGKPPAAIGIDLNSGVSVEVVKGEDTGVTSAALALVEALNSGPHLNARLVPNGPEHLLLRRGTIEIVVGPKPP
jgi:hypothetical protein